MWRWVEMKVALPESFDLLAVNKTVQLNVSRSNLQSRFVTSVNVRIHCNHIYTVDMCFKVNPSTYSYIILAAMHYGFP